MILGLIPARGGSKGVPGKNIRRVSGKPLIAYAIECGLQCPSIEHVVVSTDSVEIAEIAKGFGAEVPFLRPAEIAADTTPMLPVMQHCISSSESFYHTTVEFLVLLDPTGPLRLVEDIEHCIRRCKESDCDAIISGNVAHRNPYFNMVKEEESYVQLVCSTNGSIGRRQDAPSVYDLNTVVWVYSRKALMEEQARIPKKTQLYLVPPERSIDLDTEFDFRVLGFLLKEREVSEYR